MEGWTLRDELVRTIKEWYLVLGFVVLGALIGLSLAYIFPAEYTASADLYAGIDITRVNEMDYLIPLADEEPLNLDDYKNWQMKQLSDVLVLDLVLEEVLDQLKESDPSWIDVTLGDFRTKIDIYWYDTGIWRLEVSNKDPGLAEMAVQTWLDVSYSTISERLIKAEQVTALDLDLQTNKSASAVKKSEIAQIQSFQSSAEEWLNLFSTLPQDETLPDERLEELQAWVLVYLKGQGDWSIPMGGFPGENQSVADYAVWLQTALTGSSIALEEISNQYDLLIEEREEILPDYYQALDDALGLSANIVLESNTSIPSVGQSRNVGSNVIGGAFLGLMAWLVFAIVRIRGQNDESN
jgi:hypothetical protein